MAHQFRVTKSFLKTINIRTADLGNIENWSFMMKQEKRLKE
jgi:hypothetical protein